MRGFARICWLGVGCGAGLGCDLVSGLDGFEVGVGPPSLVGNGVIDEGEACDDANAVAGDGCDASGQVEKGWGCLEEGQPCLRLTGFLTEPQGELTPVGSATGGTAFSETCTGESELLVGFEGVVGADFLGQTHAICVAFAVSAEGRLEYATGADQVLGMDYASNMTGTSTDVLCPVHEVVIGMEGHADNEVRGLSLACAEVSFGGGAFTRDGETFTPLHGYDTLPPSPVTVCSDSQAVQHFNIRAGGHIDQLQLGCDGLEPTYCGDTRVDEPFEECDGGDACDEFCQAL